MTNGGPLVRDPSACPPFAAGNVIGDAGRQGEIVPAAGSLTVGIADTELDFATVDSFMAQLAAKRIDHRSDMEVCMRVDPDSHLHDIDGARVVCDDGHRCPLVVLNGWAAPASRRWTRQ